jgi:hypothetical protein
MQPFAPCDRVVAINTDLSAPIYGPANPESYPFLFPDGPLRNDVIYHVASVSASGDGNQCLHLTGIRVFWGSQEMPWNSTRFRKVDALKGHLPKKRRRKQPVAATCLLTPHLQHP